MNNLLKSITLLLTLLIAQLYFSLEADYTTPITQAYNSSPTSIPFTFFTGPTTSNEVTFTTPKPMRTIRIGLLCKYNGPQSYVEDIGAFGLAMDRIAAEQLVPNFQFQYSYNPHLVVLIKQFVKHFIIILITNVKKFQYKTMYSIHTHTRM